MKPTVLVGIPCLLVGGTEVQTLRLVEALIQGGYTVVVACYFEYDSDMVRQYREAGALVECLSPHGTRPTGLKAQWRLLHQGLRRIVRTYRPSIAHIQYMAPGALPIISLRLLGVKTILATAHTMGDYYKSTCLVRHLQRHWLKAFTCITENAERSFFGTSQLYSEVLPLKRHNHFTIYNCLKDLKDFTGLKGLNPTAPRIGFVSRLEAIKGADFIIPAFAELRQHLPQATLTIVGDGKLHPLMLQQQEALGLDIHWLPRQPQHLLPAIYRDLDILWMPSRSEGFGLTAIEALAEGTLVIGARTGGLSEILPDPRLLCDPESPASLAQTTLRLLDNPPTPPSIEPYLFTHYKRLILSLYSKL